MAGTRNQVPAAPRLATTACCRWPKLKLLRSLQKEVNDRTKAFMERHPDPKKLGPKEKAELQEIRREQKEVADLLEQLTRPAGEEPMPDEDEKDADEKDNGAKQGEEK